MRDNPLKTKQLSIQERKSLMSHDNANIPTCQAIVASSDDLHALLEQASRRLPIAQPKRGRPPTLTRPHLALAILMCLLQGWHSQLQVWREIAGKHVGPFAPLPLSDEAVYKQLARNGVACLQQLFDHVSLWLRQRLIAHEDRSLAPFAREVLALDESTLAQVGRWLPWLREVPTGHSRLLAGRLCCLFDLRRQQWAQVALLPEAKANCKLYAPEIVQQVRKGSLLVFDRGYLSFPLFDQLTGEGIWWLTRYANKVNYQIVHVYYHADGVLDALVQLGSPKGDRAAYTVRLISVRVRGKTCTYLTNVVDPHLLPLDEMVRLYARRWDIEVAFRLLKDHLPANDIWSAKWQVIAVHIWACLILAQLFHGLQIELAAQAGVELFDVSVHLLVRYAVAQMREGRLPFGGDVLSYARRTRIIRPSTRLPYQAPHLSWQEICWPATVLVWHREPHYRQRNCGPMSQRSRKRPPC
jgi:hypothetical protein